MLRLIGKIGYWVVAVALVAGVLLSFGYNVLQSLLIALMFFPGALALCFFLPKAQRPIDKLWFCLSLLVAEILLLMMGHIWLSEDYFHPLVVRPVMINPIFLGMLLALLALGHYYWNRWMDRQASARRRNITFFSDRKSVTIDVMDLAYIESNDTEVRLYMTDGGVFRNKTGITQWENLLGEPFVRIHRSYLVNRNLIESSASDSVTVLSRELPISRKYRGTVRFGTEVG